MLAVKGRLLLQLLRDSEGRLLHRLPLWDREDLENADLIAEFQREARVVRKAVTGDLTKVERDLSPFTHFVASEWY